MGVVHRGLTVNDTAKWLIGLVISVGGATYIADRLATRRERRKQADDDSRVAKTLMRKLETDMHLALMALVEARRELDPELTGGDCKPQLARLTSSLQPLVEALNQLDTLKDTALVGNFTEWLRRTRLLLDEANNADLGNPAHFVAVNELVIHNEAPPIRADVRRRMIELESLGNRMFENIRGRQHDAR